MVLDLNKIKANRFYLGIPVVTPVAGKGLVSGKEEALIWALEKDSASYSVMRGLKTMPETAEYVQQVLLKKYINYAKPFHGYWGKTDSLGWDAEGRLRSFPIDYHFQFQYPTDTEEDPSEVDEQGVHFGASEFVFPPYLGVVSGKFMDTQIDYQVGKKEIDTELVDQVIDILDFRFLDQHPHWSYEMKKQIHDSSICHHMMESAYNITVTDESKSVKGYYIITIFQTYYDPEWERYLSIPCFIRSDILEAEEKRGD